MNFLERKRKMEYLLQLIESGGCRSLETIANRFHCSKRTIERIISDLRDDGHDIRYCRSAKRFFVEK